MPLQVFTVDAFTSSPFSGNPAAVVPLLQPLPDKTLQKIAAEFNISETAFITPTGHHSSSPAPVAPQCWGKEMYELRWFTPKNEVQLCGHATLASAHVLFEEFGNNSDQLAFHTLSGPLLARRDRSNGSITLEMPSNPPVPLSASERLLSDLLVKEVVGEGVRVKEVLISEGAKKLLIRLDDSCTREQLEGIRPNFQELLALHDGNLFKSIIVTLKGGAAKGGDAEGGGGSDLAEYHFASRNFAPWHGIPEDPVTGSAHTVLGPYWAKELGINHLKCRQCSPRGGDLRVEVLEDGRVDVSGQAVTVLRGNISF